MRTPTVSIITPTTFDRAHFNEQIKEMMQAQDYPNIVEHVFDYTLDRSIGAKRNALVEEAVGDVILHFDSDDMYAPDWVSHSVRVLVTQGLDMTGLKSVYFSDQYNKAWLYQYKGSQGYVCGATMCYWKKHWARHPFRDLQNGEDTGFCAYGGRIKAHGYVDGFIARIHGRNTASHQAIAAMQEIDRGRLPKF